MNNQTSPLGTAEEQALKASLDTYLSQLMLPSELKQSLLCTAVEQSLAQSHSAVSFAQVHEMGFQILDELLQSHTQSGNSEQARLLASAPSQTGTQSRQQLAQTHRMWCAPEIRRRSMRPSQYRPERSRVSSETAVSK